MMNDWKLVPSFKKKGRRGGLSSGESGLSEEEVCCFLSGFKTQPCANQDNHDPRSCAFYHDETDCRRNPFNEYYEVDEAFNNMERMYHPVLFRTELCNRGKDCPFRKTCSFAHSKADLRKRDENSEQYEYHHLLQHSLSHASSNRKLGSFFPSDRIGFCIEPDFYSIWQQVGLPVKRIFQPLAQYQLFLLRSSKTLFNAIREFAIQDGLVQVTLGIYGQKNGIYFRGIHVEETMKGCLELLNPPSDHFSVETREYGERVVEYIGDTLRTKPELLISPTESKRALVEILSETSIRVSAVRWHDRTASETIQSVLGKIKLWISVEGYDKFVECCCCLDKRKPDQGVMCSNGHFFCSVGGCFDEAVASQIVQIQSRPENQFLCPICNDPYETQALAAHLSSDKFDHVMKAIIDSEVAQKTLELQRQFDERLEKEVQKLLSKYNDASAMLKDKARREAMNIRNTILNLACPHCGAAYAEFDGCMALACSTCKGNFCGYCHMKCNTSGGAHEHVRFCLMNTTPDSSYYATEEQVKDAQRQYRTRELKKRLKEFKKDIQNAIVIELTNDLKDLGIKPEALYLVGNLLPLQR